MVKIPEILDPTLVAMEKAVEKENLKRERRQYLGASMIGDPCARKIWYEYNNYPFIGSSAIGIMAADSGHYAEDKTAERLRLVDGIELHTHKEDGEQYGFSALDGKFKGHVDGLIRGLKQAPKSPHIWEHKDKDHKKFTDFQNKKAEFGEKSALANWNEAYYAQAQVNMHYFHIDRHYMTVSYAGGRKYDSCRTEYNPAMAEKYINKAERILQAQSEPDRLSDNPDFYLCRFCQFREVCHKDA